jgi:HIM1
MLTTLLSSSKFTSVQAYSRKTLSASSPKLQTIESSDSATWPSKFPTGASIFFSALGTTRGQAGSVEAQRKIDYDLNLDLAKAAHAAGVNTFVLVSTSGANSSSMIPYSKMKGELEEQVQKIGFRYVVILRPGLIVGHRTDSRPAEYVIRQIATFAGKIGGNRMTDAWAQNAEVIAKAGVHAAIQCVEGKRKEDGLWLLSQADIVRLGRTEWIEETGTAK